MSTSTTKTKNTFEKIVTDKDKKRLEKALATVLISNIESKVAPLMIKDKKAIKDIMSIVRVLKSLY